MVITLDNDIRILVEHLESRGVKVDELLNEHLLKINGRLSGSNEPDLDTDIPKCIFDLSDE